VGQYAVSGPGHGVHSDQQSRVDTALQIFDVLRPLVLDDVFAVRIEFLRHQRVERPPLTGAVTVHHYDLGRAAGLRPPDGGVDLTGVEPAPFLVHRVAAGDLVEPHDSGDAFHVGNDEDALDANDKAIATSLPMTGRA